MARDEAFKIGIIADTRLVDNGAPGLFGRLRSIFEGVDVILHAGNICKQFVLDELEKIAPVVAARGPMDDPADFTVDLPESKVIEARGYKIGIFPVHPGDAVAKEKGIDILVTGNTCIPRVRESREIRLSLDPGSPTFPAKYDKGTVILLKLGKLLFSYIIKV